MEKTHKYLILVIIGTTCFTGLILFNYYIVPEWQASLNQSNNDDDAYVGLDNPLQEVHNITLIVDYNGELETKKVKDFNLTSGKTTAFDAVDKWCDVEYWEGKKYITYIDGVGIGWTYYVNEPPLPNKPAIEFYLNNGDKVYWTYVGEN